MEQKRIGLTPNNEEWELLMLAMKKAKQKKLAPFVLSLAIERAVEKWPEIEKAE